MTRPSALPEPLGHGPFSVATAREMGVSERRLRARDLDRSDWGVRAGASQKSLIERCAMLQIRMPSNSFFSHSTAALIYGMPMPRFIENDPALHVSVPAPARAPHAIGIVGHRTSAPSATALRGGVRVASPERTWCDLGAILSVSNLVAAGDFIIYHRAPLASMEQLALALRTATNRRGRRKLEVALLRLDGRSESPQESRLRLILQNAGLRVARINHVVTDRFGEFVARTDFHLDDLNVVLEYQGDYHRTTVGQWRSDMTRRSKIEATGPRVMELNADDLRDPIELVARIRALAALARN